MEINKWLQVPKDVWKLIVLASLDPAFLMCIGWFDFPTIARLRRTCRYFARLLEPKFCLMIIYFNPAADDDALFECPYCSAQQLFPPETCGVSHEALKNPYFNQRGTYLKKRWKWVQGKPCLTTFGVPLRRCEARRLVSSAPLTPLLPPLLPQVTETSVFNRRGNKLFAKDVCRKPHQVAMTSGQRAKNLTEPQFGKWYGCRPRPHGNRRRSKFWKRGYRGLPRHVNCGAGYECDECLAALDQHSFFPGPDSFDYDLFFSPSPFFPSFFDYTFECHVKGRESPPGRESLDDDGYFDHADDGYFDYADEYAEMLGFD